jgi:hypothetical protein
VTAPKAHNKRWPDADRRATPAGARATFTLRDYRQEDEPRVMALLAAGFGTWPHGITGHDPVELFRWKHELNPLGPSSRVVVEADGALIGFCASIRWRMSANGQVFEVSRGADAVVDRASRGQGVYSAIVREGTPRDVAFTLSSPNELSRARIVHLGAHELGVFPLLTRAPALLRSARGLIRRRSALYASGADPRIDAESAAQALGDDPAISALLSGAERPHSRFTTVRDVEYLRWRYGGLRDYRCVREYRSGELVGIGIFRVRPRGRWWMSIVCELLTAPGDRAAARGLFHKIARAAPVDCIICHFPPGSTARQAAIRCGFLPTWLGPSATVRNIADGITPDPRARDSWAVTLGDLDLV